MSYETKNPEGELIKIISKNKLMSGIFSTIDKVKDTDAPVLLIGETGTGKELLAYALHFNSIRENKPFNPIILGSYTLDMIASQLFGHEQGAYTDAKITTNGLFSTTADGTLFLDEVNELPETTQIKLLKPVGERYFYRVGSTRRINTYARVIAAAKKTKGMRPDLYQRLSVIRIDLPPLRARGEDVPLLIEHFFNMYSKKHGKDGGGIGKLMDYYNRELKSYTWPGNVRELENLVERYITTTQLKIDRRIIQSETSPPSDTYKWLQNFMAVNDRVPTYSEIEEWSNGKIEDIVMHIVTHFDHNVSEAARAMDVHRNTLQSKLRKIKTSLPKK